MESHSKYRNRTIALAAVLGLCLTACDVPSETSAVPALAPTTTEYMPTPGHHKEEFPDPKPFIINTPIGRFAWPVGRPHSSLYYTGHEFTLPCASANTCHHDHTPAADIAYSNPNDIKAQIFPTDTEIVGEPVWAFTDGYAETVKEDPNAPGCYRIQFHGDNGKYYWYGHIVEPLVGDGQPVEVGQRIASVGGFNCVPDGGPNSYPHLHIDEGQTINGVAQHGGGAQTDTFGNPCVDECRDGELIPILNTLLVEMPE